MRLTCQINHRRNPGIKERNPGLTNRTINRPSSCRKLL